MPRSTNDSNESRKRFAHLALVFTVVIEKYRDLCNLCPLVCSQIDSDAPSNRRLDFAAVEYLADITNACAHAIAGQRNQQELENAIDKLIAGDQTVSETLVRQVIRLCGAVFEKRQLEPAKYLQKIRRGGVGQRVAL